jgi:predicted CopG family antitoxin
MLKEMTISVEEDVYDTLARLSDRRALGEYISSLVRSQNPQKASAKAVADAEAKRKSDELVDRFYGAWQGDKSAEEMVAEIRADRRSGGREIEPL